MTPEEYRKLLEEKITFNTKEVRVLSKFTEFYGDYELNMCKGALVAYQIALEKFADVEQYIRGLIDENENLNEAINGMAANEAERAREVSQGMYRE